MLRKSTMNIEQIDKTLNNQIELIEHLFPVEIGYALKSDTKTIEKQMNQIIEQVNNLTLIVKELIDTLEKINIK